MDTELHFEEQVRVFWVQNMELIGLIPYSKQYLQENKV